MSRARTCQRRLWVKATAVAHAQHFFFFSGKLCRKQCIFIITVYYNLSAGLYVFEEFCKRIYDIVNSREEIEVIFFYIKYYCNGGIEIEE